LRECRRCYRTCYPLPESRAGAKGSRERWLTISITWPTQTMTQPCGTTIFALLRSGPSQTRRMVRKEGEVILKLGAEGGSLTLYGFRIKEGWSFTLGTYDCTPVLIDEGPPMHRKSGVVDRWDAALKLLDQNPSWPKLHPISIHPDFKTKVWVAVQKRLQPPP